MQDYANRVSSAGIEATVAEVRSALDEMTVGAEDVLSDVEPHLIERLQLLLDRVLVVVGTTIPQLVTQTRVNTLLQVLAEAHSRVRQMIQSPSQATVANLAATAETLAGELGAWPGAGTHDWREAVTGAASTYRRSAGQQIRDVLDQARSISEDLARLSAAVDQINGAREEADERLARVIEDRAKEVGARFDTIDARQAQASTHIDSNIDRIDQAVARFESQFSAAQDTRTKQFNEQLQDAAAEVDALSRRLTDKAEGIVKEIAAQHDKSAELVSVFAAGGTANAYGREATKQGTVADRLRVVAMAFGLGAGVAAFWLAQSATQGESLSAGTITGRVLLSLLLGSIASYAAAQSSRHRKREEQNRQTELQLVAFEPFIRELSEEEKEKARVTVVGRLLSVDPVAADDATMPALTNDHISLFQKIIAMGSSKQP